LSAKGYFKTPNKIVEHMIEKLFEERHPTSMDTILDPGCGPGDFIQGIIKWCKKNILPLPKITGVELDTEYASQAEAKFDKYKEIKIEQRDYLINNNKKYDFIIGNPPYVPITQLSEEEKKRYKPLFITAKGRFDLYLLFFEKSLNSLKENGRMVFITPEKFIYVKTAEPLRKILTEKRIKEIEFLEENTFKGLTTYPTISIIENLPPQNQVKILYRNGVVKNVVLPKYGESWLPIMNGEKNMVPHYTLKDICQRISCGVATGADKIFIRKEALIKSSLKKYAYPTISGRELKYGRDLPSLTNYMLMPYNMKGKLMPFNELGSLGTYLSQQNNVKRLKERTCTKRKPWYAFHETPPMKYLLQPKILCKDISIKPSFWLDGKGHFIPRHSIYYIVPKNASKIDIIYDYLKSDSVIDWLERNCQRAANNYIRLQSNILKNLPIPEALYKALKVDYSMTVSIEPYVFSNAVRQYWNIRGQQGSAQEEKGVSDTGERSKVTGGQQMNGFSDKITELLVASGIPESDIYVKNHRELPGFFRPHKGWDIVVVSKKKLLSAIELKSQVGPSFGNNFNNRTEEALGSAIDFWTAYRENAFGASPQPWLGYIFLLEDCPASKRNRGVREPHFKVLPEFKDTSYALRYELLCRKLVLERQYSAACLIFSDSNKKEKNENYVEPAVDLSATQFLKQLLNHVNLSKNI
jgi:cyclopropane fatty-acyl-phospholipid synthase-like methyltransferase